MKKILDFNNSKTNNEVLKPVLLLIADVHAELYTNLSSLKSVLAEYKFFAK